MATASITFTLGPGGLTSPFTDPTVGGTWTSTAGANSTLTDSTTGGDNADGSGQTGCLQYSISGKNHTSTTSKWVWSGAWTTLGVPAGTVIQQVQWTYAWSCITFTTGASSSIGGASTGINDSTGTQQVADGSAASTFSATTAYADHVGSTMAVPAVIAPAASSVQLEFDATLATGNSTSASVVLALDFIRVTVTFAVAVLAAPGVPVPRTAERARRRPLPAWPVQPVAATTSGPPVYPLLSPVQARRPLPPRGRCMTVISMAFMLLGPPVTPLQGPVRVHPTPPPRGRTQSLAGTFTATAVAPASVYPLQHPVAAVTRPLPRRGRTGSNAGVFNQVGPPFHPDSSPVASGSTSAASSSRNGARLPGRGRTASNAGVFNQLGPPVYPLQHPVAAVVRPLPKRGRTYSNQGTFNQLGPTFIQQPKPSQARQPLPPRGRSYTRTGTYSQLGPQVYPLQQPVRARRPLPRRGRALTSPVPSVVAAPPPNLTVAYPLLHPVAATTRPLPQRGRVASNAGIRQQTGPQVYPLLRPVAAVSRPLPKRGRVNSSAGTFGQLGPQVYPLLHPVSAVTRPLPQRGRDYSRAGIFGQLGPQVYPLQHPVQARRPLPPRGRVASNAGAPVSAAAPNLTAYYPLGHPAAAVTRPLPRRGRISSNAGIQQPTGPAFYPLNHPVKATQPLPPRGRTAARYGTFTAVAGTAPFFPLNRPVAAVARPLPARGREYSNRGVFNQVGPPVKALQHPVMAFRNPIRPGYSVTSIRVAPPATLGPPVYPLRRPVRAPYPYLHRRAGGVTAHTLPYVAPFIPQGGHGYPYTGILTADRWPAQVRNSFWLASVNPDRYEAVSVPARWPAQLTESRWDAVGRQ